jgi:hypothetical protein
MVQPYGLYSSSSSSSAFHCDQCCSSAFELLRSWAASFAAVLPPRKPRHLLAAPAPALKQHQGRKRDHSEFYKGSRGRVYIGYMLYTIPYTP